MAFTQTIRHTEARCLARQLKARLRLADRCDWLPAIGYSAWADPEAALARWVQEQIGQLQISRDAAFETLSERLQRRLMDWFDS